MLNNEIPVDSIGVIFTQFGYRHLAYRIINYLDEQTLSSIISMQHFPTPNKQKNAIQKLQSQKQDLNGQGILIISDNKNAQSYSIYQPYIIKMINSFVFTQQYLNKSDKSMHFSCYDEQSIKQLQKRLTEKVVMLETQNHIINMNNLLPKYQTQTLSHQIIVFKNICQQLQSQFCQLERIIIDPSLPLPTLKRQNQGLYCNSPFQMYLVGLRFSHQQFSEYHQFEELREKLQNKDDEHLKLFLQLCSKIKHHSKQQPNQQIIKQYESLHILRFTPYQITSEDYKQYEIPHHQLHNLIVSLFALIDCLLKSTNTYLSQIDQPCILLLQFVSRYSIYRSVILEIQETFGFAFQMYESLFNDTMQQSLSSNQNKLPKYSFWRPAMSKWFLIMGYWQKPLTNLYIYLLTEKRKQALRNCIKCCNGHANKGNPNMQSKLDCQLQQVYSSLFQNPLIKGQSIQLSNQLELLQPQFSGQKTPNLSKSVSFDTSSLSMQTINALLYQYPEYLVDMNINQQTVHWCGHSKHHLEQPFNDFSQQFRVENMKYFEYLRSCVSATTNKSCYVNNNNNNEIQLLGKIADENFQRIFYAIIQYQINWLESMNVKPVIIRQIVEQINSQDGQFFSGYTVNKISIKQSQATFTCKNSLIPPLMLIYDYTQKDSKLRYFNQKARISQFINSEQNFYFSIPPLLSVSQILLKSINSHHEDNPSGYLQTMNENQDEESYQYISQNQEEQLEQHENSKQSPVIIDSSQYNVLIDSKQSSVQIDSKPPYLLNEIMNLQQNTNTEKEENQEKYQTQSDCDEKEKQSTRCSLIRTNPNYQSISQSIKIVISSSSPNYYCTENNIQKSLINQMSNTFQQITQEKLSYGSQVELNLGDDQEENQLQQITLKKKLSSSCKNQIL